MIIGSAMSIPLEYGQQEGTVSTLSGVDHHYVLEVLTMSMVKHFPLE